jgi:hypothetical protein
MYNSAGEYKDPLVLWDKTEPVAYLSAGVRQQKLQKRVNDKVRKDATEVAKTVCADAFSETKKQCSNIALETTVVGCQLAIKQAGIQIVATVEKNLPAPNSVAVDTLKRVMLTSTRELGESTQFNQPITVEGMAALGCEKLWKGTEALCQKGNIEKDFGKVSVERGMYKYGSDIGVIANTAAQMTLATNPPTQAPTKQAYASEFADEISEYAQPSDNDSEDTATEDAESLEERLGESIDAADDAIEQFREGDENSESSEYKY